MAVKSYANPFLCSIFIHVEAEIWKTAQNSIITWFNWATNFTQLFFSPQLWTQWAGRAVVPWLSIQQYPGNWGLHLTISPSVPVFPRETIPMLPVLQDIFTYIPRLSIRLEHNKTNVKHCSYIIRADVNKPHISFKVKSNYYEKTCLFLNLHNKDASLCERTRINWTLIWKHPLSTEGKLWVIDGNICNFNDLFFKERNSYLPRRFIKVQHKHTHTHTHTRTRTHTHAHTHIYTVYITYIYIYIYITK